MLKVLGCGVGASVNTAVIYYRKVWNYAYVVHVSGKGMLQSGKRGIGFGCGKEPILSFLGSLGQRDQQRPSAGQRKAAGWGVGGPVHRIPRQRVLREDLVERETFNKLADPRYAR
jgi:hypothetical protein